MPSRFSRSIITALKHHRQTTHKPGPCASDANLGYGGPETPPETETFLESRQPPTAEQIFISPIIPLFHLEPSSFIFRPPSPPHLLGMPARGVEGEGRGGREVGDCEIVNLTFVGRSTLSPLPPSLFPVPLAFGNFPSNHPRNICFAPSRHRMDLSDYPIFGPSHRPLAISPR